MSADKPVRRAAVLAVGGCAAGLLIAGIAAGGAVLTPFEVVRARLDALAGDGSADPYTPHLHARLRLGMALLGLAAMGAGALLWRGRRRVAGGLQRVASEAGRTCAWLWRLQHRVIWPAAGTTLLAISVRAPYLDQPIRFDEAYTVNQYASQPWFVALSRYDAPNNHVLHSLLVLMSTRVFGEELWAVRLPALVAGVLLVPATMLLAAAVGGRMAAVFAGLLVATSSPLVEYSTNGRGYTLVALCMVVGWLLAMRLVRRCDRGAWLGWGAAMVVGCWTIPTMVYGWLMQVAWMEWQCCAGVVSVGYGGGRGRVRGKNAVDSRPSKTAFRRWLWGMTVAAGVVTVACYLPVLLVSGPRALVGNSYVVSPGMGVLVGGVWPWLANVGALLGRDVPLPVLALLAAGFVAAMGNGNGWVRFARRTAAASLAAAVLLMIVQRVLPFPRVWLFVLPPGAVLIGTGLARMMTWVPNRAWRAAACVLTGLVIAGWPAWTMVRNDSVRQSLETGTLPDAEPMVADLQGLLRPGEPVITVAPSSAPLVYWGRRTGLDLAHFDRPGSAGVREDCAVVIVNRRHPESVEDVLGQHGLEERYEGREFRVVKEYSSAAVYRWEAEGL